MSQKVQRLPANVKPNQDLGSAVSAESPQIQPNTATAALALMFAPGIESPSEIRKRTSRQSKAAVRSAQRMPQREIDAAQVLAAGERGQA